MVFASWFDSVLLVTLRRQWSCKRPLRHWSCRGFHNSQYPNLDTGWVLKFSGLIRNRTLPSYFSKLKHLHFKVGWCWLIASEYLCSNPIIANINKCWGWLGWLITSQVALGGWGAIVVPFNSTLAPRADGLTCAVCLMVPLIFYLLSQQGMLTKT